MVNKINITCKQASFLMNKKQETPISYFEKLRLYIHIIKCKTCKIYQRQLFALLKMVSKKEKKLYLLDNQSKSKLKSILNAEIDNSTKSSF